VEAGPDAEVSVDDASLQHDASWQALYDNGCSWHNNVSTFLDAYALRISF